MPDLKLGRLPDRTPVRMSFQAHPELARALQAYAELYRETYGHVEAVSDLIPYMLESFLAGDRAFVRTFRERRIGPEVTAGQKVLSPGASRNDIFTTSLSAKES